MAKLTPERNRVGVITALVVTGLGIGWLAGLSPEARAAAMGFFTTIRRTPDGKLQVVPYSLEYQGELALAAVEVGVEQVERDAANARLPHLDQHVSSGKLDVDRQVGAVRLPRVLHVRVAVAESELQLVIDITGAEERGTVETGLVLWTLLRRPKLFPLAITLAIYGFHFRRVFKELVRAPRKRGMA